MAAARQRSCHLARSDSWTRQRAETFEFCITCPTQTFLQGINHLLSERKSRKESGGDSMDARELSQLNISVKH